MRQTLRKLTLMATPLLLVFSIGFATLTPALVQAAPKDEVQGGFTAAGGSASDADPSASGTLRTTIQKIINILLFIIGIIAVIVIVIAGIQYATSGGNAEQSSKAKNAIIYAVVGIIVAVMAYAIVGFVVGNI